MDVDYEEAENEAYEETEKSDDMGILTDGFSQEDADFFGKLHGRRFVCRTMCCNKKTEGSYHRGQTMRMRSSKMAAKTLRATEVKMKTKSLRTMESKMATKLLRTMEVKMKTKPLKMRTLMIRKTGNRIHLMICSALQEAAGKQN